MNKIKECKKFNFAPVVIALVLFFRAYLLSDRNRMGFANFYPLTFDFSTQGIVLISLLAVFAVLAALVISKLGKRFGDTVSFVSLLLVAEPLLFTKEENCVNLIVWIVGLLFVLTAIAEKSFIPKEVTLVIFLFVACVLVENAIFLFVAPAIVLYIAGDIEKLAANAKKIIALIVSVVSVGAGILLNDYLVKNVSAFDELIKEYSFYQQIYFKNIEYENVLLFGFAIPVLIFGISFFAKLFKSSKSETAAKKSDKKQETAKAYNAVPALICVAVAYILSVAGFVIAGSNAFYTINYIIPAAVISMLCSNNEVAEKALEKTNRCFSKYSLIVIAVAVFMCYLAVRIFFADVDNLATFIMKF